MKKVMALTLALVMILSLLGCAQGVESCPAGENGDDGAISAPPEGKVQAEKPVLKEPPVLTVACGRAGVEASRGGYHWIVPDGDGTMTATIADSEHPLDMKEYMACLNMTGELPRGDGIWTGTLQFAVVPDDVSVRCWSTDCWGRNDAASEVVKLSGFDGNVFYFDLRDTAAVYEVTAIWKDQEHSNSAFYSFYTATGIAAQTP